MPIERVSPESASPRLGSGVCSRARPIAWVIGFLSVGLVGLTTMACAPHRGERGSGRFGAGLPQVAATPEIRSLERKMFDRLNRDRVAQGKPPLAYDERLASVARSHSADMRDHGFFEHDSPRTGSPDDRLDAAGYLFLTARENLAKAGSVDGAEDDLLKSPRHHENIMADDITHVGIGIVHAGASPPALLFTQVFARPGKSESVAAARQSVSAAIQKARRAENLPLLPEQPRLSELAQAEIIRMPEEPGEDDLKRIRDAIGAGLGKSMPKLKGIAVSGQVLPDSSQFQVSPALLRSTARSYGLAVEKSSKPGARPLLRVLVLVGL